MNQFFKSINTSSVAKRVLLMLLPIFMMPLGVAAFYACHLGSDPFSVFIDGLHAITGKTYGQITTIYNSVMLVIMLIFGRKYINIGTVVLSFTTGPLIDFFRNWIIVTFHTDAGGNYLVRGIILLLGSVVFAMGVGFYIAIEIGIGPMEFLMLYIVGKTKLKIKYVRIGMDTFFVIVGFLMGGIVGIGTVLGVLATGPIVETTLKLCKAPISKFVGPLRKISQVDQA